jgi:RNA polymerase sigma-70 factor (ECF subfamily)
MVSVARHEALPSEAPEAATETGDFRALYDDHFDFVWRTLLHFGVQAAQAEDAAQEVFVILHRRRADYDGSTPLRSWLWGMCRRVAQAQRRGVARAQRRSEVAPAPHPSLPPDAALEQKQAVDFVERFLEGLSEELRPVFVMMEIEGMSAPEVAAALGVNVNTVYSRLRLARAQLEQASARLRTRDARAAG